MAAALALLVILPVLAADGQVTIGTGEDLFNVSVFDDFADIEINGGTGNATGVIDVGDNLYTADGNFRPQDTRVGTTLYVSNATPAYDHVLVTFRQSAGAFSGDATVSVDVEASGGEDLTLTLVEATADDWQGVFQVIDTDTATGNQIFADHGETIKVTAPDNTVLNLTVDGEGPEITGTSPENENIGDDDAVVYTGTITDGDSGLRDDSEDAGNSANAPDGADDDTDGITEDEPITVAGGASQDIDINLDLDNATTVAGGGDDESNRATIGWTVVTDGFSFTFEKGGHSGDHFWNIVARDRVNNETTTDVDRDDDDEDNFLLTVDDDRPELARATTGTGYDIEDEEQEDDPSAIWLEWENLGGNVDDDIDIDSVSNGDFILSDGLSVINVVQDEDNDSFLYIYLNRDLDADETPDIQLLAGTVLDVAGNSNEVTDVEADDGIEPTLTVTIVGEASSRPITADEITITITSDEELDTAPTIYFVTFVEATDTADEIQIQGTPETKTPTETGTNSWEATVDADDVGINTSGIGGVFVVGEDTASPGNEGITDGLDDGDDRVPNAGDVVDLVDLQDADLLFEIDVAIAAAAPSVLPGNEDLETESRSPFIRLSFAGDEDEAGEEDEYGIDNLDGDGDTFSFTYGDDRVDTDDHEIITLVSITLDGVDVSDAVARVDDNTFNLATTSLSLGIHEVVYTATDEVGNEIEDEDFEFEVIERSDYEVSLDPGWNLISLPGTPVAPGLDDVLPDSMKASRVLQWVDGAFRVAERDSDGTWDPSGQVTELVAGFGYWIFTTAFESIEALIPERNPATSLPTVEIVGGWNLIGIIDLQQQDEDTVIGEADDYLTSIEWSVAYGFDTQNNLFTKLAGDDDLLVGHGYWVWATESGTLVP